MKVFWNIYRVVDRRLVELICDTTKTNIYTWTPTFFLNVFYIIQKYKTEKNINRILYFLMLI